MNDWKSIVVIFYLDQKTVPQYQPLLSGFLEDLSVIHKLDFRASLSSRIVGAPKGAGPLICDLIFYRSTSETQITLSEFQDMIQKIFSKMPSLDIEGVGVDLMDDEHIDRYPFPD